MASLHFDEEELLLKVIIKRLRSNGIITKNILKSVFGMASLHLGEEELTFKSNN